ncbi:GNAT family N-acetyltransferase [Amycolatopsis aidingensis]|uniref:GNAT family N-acetyltransferase n=1 Tax=Amycolatopsis aidingensis TaxID=2842453 RepID=UPI001C0C0115|nr:GNAT family protein [Amycolatopsis aidingensis]
MSTPGHPTQYAVEPRHPGWPARPGPLRVAGGELALRPVRLRDGAEWSRIRLRDRTYLENWEPTSAGTWQERNGLSAWLPQWWALRGLARRGHCLPFAITLDGRLAGQLTLGNVIRSSLRSAWIGYWVSAELAGKGLATGAVALAVDHAFGEAGLHRIEATVRPENTASLRVLDKVGFRKEGLFQRYLDVAGDWRDHLCFALTAEETGEGLVRRIIAAGLAEHAG